MKILSIENNKLVISPESLVIDSFRKIWDRDKGKNKEGAMLDLLYIFLKGSVDSPLFSLPEKEREEQIFKFYIKQKYVPDRLVMSALQEYKEISMTPGMRLLEGAYMLLSNLENYFRTANFIERDENGKPVFSAKEAVSNLKEVGAVLLSLNKLKETVHKESAESFKNRGGADTGEFEDPD